MKGCDTRFFEDCAIIIIFNSKMVQLCKGEQVLTFCKTNLTFSYNFSITVLNIYLDQFWGHFGVHLGPESGFEEPTWAQDGDHKLQNNKKLQ